MDAINVALSGLNASTLKLGASASNVANAQSLTTVQNGQKVNEPYTPQEVAQQSQPNGGVKASLRDVQPPSIPVFAPESPAANDQGIVQAPNVNMVEETSNQLQAVSSYKANLNVMQKANEAYESLLDIKS